MAASALLLSQVGLAKRWNKSTPTIRRWTEKGLLPTFTDPETGRVFYPLAAIVRWETEHEPKAKAAS